ncbi:MAG TPA: hypothetical protein H9985_04310 [Candidatus Anaerofilum faecale]|nr:hypothetical protein [Candidatus Anaerofilum faecale]
MKISENGVHRELTLEEEAKWIADATKAEREEKTRPLTDSEVFRLFAAQSINTLPLDNNTALRCLSYHPEWADLCAQNYKAEKKGYRFQYAGKLYETVQPEFTFQEQWVLGADGTASIYSRVEWQHAGTVDDPIPVPDTVPPESFTYSIGKVYDEAGTLYLCKFGSEPEGTEHSFVYKPSQVPAYFTKIE